MTKQRFIDLLRTKPTFTLKCNKVKKGLDRYWTTAFGGELIYPDNPVLENPTKKAIVEMEIDFKRGGGIHRFSNMINMIDYSTHEVYMLT